MKNYMVPGIDTLRFADIDDIEMDEKQISEIKLKLKQIEKKIKEKNKPKTITISGSDHNIIKNYCSLFNLNIGEWTSKILLKEIEQNNCLIVDKDTDEERHEKDVNNLTQKYINESHRLRYLIKCNKILFNSQFKFAGYSYIDAKPIYEFVGDMNVFKMTHDLDNMGIKFDISREGEISSNIFSNLELELETF